MNVGRTTAKRLSSTLRHRVAIQERTNTTDGEGGFTEAWADVTGYEAVPAGIWPIFATQRTQYNSVNIEATHYVILRGEIDVVESATRIKYGTRVFDVLFIEDYQERGVRKQCTCKERRE